ncbi:MAG TPA: DUF1566 domain-containing protein [Candidatus Binatia bacterium]|nr:DUF1566 domain-containing protein [Candidatus Binatia bacterium]
MQSTWVARIGIVSLVGGLFVMNYGFEVIPAGAAPPVKEDALAGITQNWDKKLPAAQRFVVLTDFGGAAVRDNETGLVWEQAPDAGIITWFQATGGCVNKSLGGRKGWRLPSVAELASLVEPANSNPSLPTGLPFTNVQSADYWSATIVAGQSPPAAWRVFFSDGHVTSAGSTDAGRAWCVRGGMNADQY